MKTFNLAIVTLAIAAAASTSALASPTYGGGNGNSADNTAAITQNDSYNGTADAYVFRPVNPVTSLSDNDADVLRLRLGNDRESK